MKNPFDVNQYTFNNSEESFEYDSSNVSDLQSPERFIIDRITPYIKNTVILDLAVGGGRTTQHLLKISKNYIGTEVSNTLLKIAKKKHPDVDFIHNDYRDLSIFQDNSFDFIMLSYNGLDYVNHKDRLSVISEILRIIKPKGIFLFSSHNYFRQRTSFKIKYRKNLINMFKQNLIGLINFLRLKDSEEFNSHYSYANLRGHNYGLLTYGISWKEQISQLKKLGFSEVMYTINNHGHNITCNEDVSDWIYYCVRPHEYVNEDK